MISLFDAYSNKYNIVRFEIEILIEKKKMRTHLYTTSV